MDPAALEDRLKRLKELLPRLLAEQPKGSAVAAVLQVMAAALVELEEAIDRTLHDHWLALANGETEADKALAILQRLAPQLGIDQTLPAEQQRQAALVWAFQQQRNNGEGALLNALEQALPQFCATKADAERLLAALAELPAAMDPAQTRLRRAWLPPRRAYGAQLSRGEGSLLGASDGLSRLGALLAMPRLCQASQTGGIEAIEAYRRRIQQSVSVLGEGATSPKALLRLAILTMGAEPCGRPMRKVHDTWIAHGVPPGLDVRGCRECSQPSVSLPWRCPQAWFEARLIDHPLREEKLSSTLGGAATCELEVLHPSLSEALPELTIAAGGSEINNPVLENRATGEQLLFLGTIPKGQQLRLQPEVEDQPRLLETSESIDPYPWRRQFPHGRARLGAFTSQGSLTDVHSQIWLLSGSRFARDPNPAEPGADVARFDTALFGGITQMDASGHALGTGRLGHIRLGPLSASVQVPRLVPGINLWRYANFNASGQGSPEALLAQAPRHIPPACTVTLAWWRRPPGSFRLELEPHLDQGDASWWDQAERIGAQVELQRLVERLRPAGVRAEVRFLQPTLKDAQSLGEQPLALLVAHAWREAHSLAEASPTLAAAARLVERQDLGDGQPAWGAVLDVCRFDWSYLQ